MRPRTTLVLLALVVVLVAFVLLWERERPGSTELEQAARRLLPAGFPLDEVSRLELEQDEALTALERDSAGTWRLVAPLEDRAERLRVERILETLDASEALGFVPERGLDRTSGEPAQRVVLLAPSGRFQLEFLETRLADSHVYARVDGGAELAVVPLRLREELAPSLDELRQARLATFGRDEVARFELLGEATEPLAFARSERGWRIEAPFEDEADASRVGAMVDALLALRADRFAANPAPGPEPWLRFAAQGEEGAALPSLEIGAPDASASARRWARIAGRPGRMRVDARPVERLLGADPESWRSRLVIDVAPSELVGLVLEESGHTLELLREGPKAPWTSRDPAVEAIQESVDEALFQLARVEALDRREALAEGHDGRRRLVLRDRRDAALVEIVLTPDAKDPARLLAEVAGRSGLFVVASEPFERLRRASLTVSKTSE